MKSLKQLSFLLSLILILFSACSNSKLPDDSLKNVPEEVTSITAFDLNQLMQKGDYEYFKQLDFFTDAMEEIGREKPALATIMKDPFISGVDLSKNAYIVMQVDKNQPEEKQFGAFIFSISDAGAFQGMLKSIGDVETQQRDNFKLVSVSGTTTTLVAWNDHFGMIGGGHSSLDLEAYVSPYFDANRKSSVINNPDLAKCLSKDYDIATWINSNSIAENPQLKTAAAFLGIGSSGLKNNYFHSYVHFENGAIKGNSKHILQKELTNDLSLFFRDGVKRDLSKFIPGEDLALAFSAALDPKGIYQIVSEKAGGTMTANAALKKFGFTSKDLADALGGDVVVAVYNNGDDLNKANGLLTATIGDEQLFNQFLDLGLQYKMIEKVDDNLYSIKEGPKNFEQTFLCVRDEVFFITNSSSMVETLQSGSYTSSERIPKDVYQLMSENAFGGVLQFDAVRNFGDQFKEIPFTTARWDAGLRSSSMELELENKNANSLKVLMELLNKTYLKNRDKEPSLTMDF